MFERIEFHLINDYADQHASIASWDINGRFSQVIPRIGESVRLYSGPHSELFRVLDVRYHADVRTIDIDVERVPNSFI